MLALSFEWEVSDDLVLSARLDQRRAGSRCAISAFPSSTATSSRDFVGTNFNVSDSVVQLRGRFDSSQSRVASVGHLRRAGRAVSADDRPDVEERGGVFPRRSERARALGPADDRSRHGADGPAHELLVLVVERRRAGVGGLRGQRRVVRPADEFRHAGQSRRNHVRRVRRRRSVQLSAGHSRGHHDGAVRAGQHVGRQPVGDLRRGAVQCHGSFRHRRGPALGRLRHEVVRARPAPASISRSMRRRAASASCSTWTTTRRCTASTAPARRTRATRS